MCVCVCVCVCVSTRMSMLIYFSLTNKHLVVIKSACFANDQYTSDLLMRNTHQLLKINILFHSVIITSFQIVMLSASVTLASSWWRDLKNSVTPISKEIQRRGKQKEEEAKPSKYLWRGCWCSLAGWCSALKYINKHSKQSAWIFYMLGGQRQ